MYKTSNEFEDAYDEILSNLEEVSLIVKIGLIIFQMRTSECTNIVSKDFVMKIYALYKERSSRAFELRTKILDSINEYKGQWGEGNDTSH
jgi:hypothetical protein